MVEEKQVKVTEQQLGQAYEAERATLDSLNKRMATFQNLMRDINGAEQSIDTVEGAENKEILVNLGAGVYKKATISKDNTVIASIGGNTLDKKNHKGAKQLLKRRKGDLQKDINALQSEINTRATNINNMAKLLSSAMQKKRQQA